ncbi:MAG: acylneuraminate cytidylyltransferase family protein [Roseburia sp.]|nr:acylneuraminate cytidylyltransferase family protein [Roseburia sp.]MCM1201657.1 acylneuraminate cytidylyltransferase family protein [Bacteroides fragilis]
MNILFTICARAGSKGVAGKNVRMFCGRPIVYYTLEIYDKFVKKYSNQIHIDLAVNTDSQQLLEQIDNRGTDYILVKRKNELAGDIVAKGEVIRDTFMTVEKMKKCEYGLIVDLDITSPLRNLEDVEGTIGRVIQNDRCNYAYSVVEARRSPYFNMVCKTEDGFYDRVISSDYTSRQQVPECFDMNASIYVWARDYLLDMRAQNRHALVWKMKDSGVLDIDSENDFEIMETLTQYYWEQGKYLDIK